jgi:hypothetical protein
MRFPRVPWRRVTSGRVLPWVLAVVFLGTTLANWWLLRDERRTDARTEVVTRTASEFLRVFTNYRASTIDEDVAAIERYAVGSFRAQFQQTFDAAAIERVKENAVVTTGHIWSLELHDLSSGTAHFRALVYETVTKKGAATTTDLFQLMVELLRAGDEWKVDQVQANILESAGSPGVPSG